MLLISHFFLYFHTCLWVITAAPYWICSHLLQPPECWPWYPPCSPRTVCYFNIFTYHFQAITFDAASLHTYLFIHAKKITPLLGGSVALPRQTFLSWTVCCLHWHADIKGTDKRSTNPGSASTCHLLNWHVKRTIVGQVDTAPHGSDASETMYRKVSRCAEQQINPTYCLICLTTKECSWGLWASFPDNFVNSLLSPGDRKLEPTLNPNERPQGWRFDSQQVLLWF